MEVDMREVNVVKVTEKTKEMCIEATFSHGCIEKGF